MSQKSFLSMLRSRDLLEQHREVLADAVFGAAYLIIVTPETTLKSFLSAHLYQDASAVALLNDRLAEMAVENGDQAEWPLSEWHWPADMRSGLVQAGTTQQRLEFLYTTAKERLIAQLAQHEAECDDVLDTPTASVLRQIRETITAHVSQVGALLRAREAPFDEDPRHLLPIAFTETGAPDLPRFPARERCLTVSDTWTRRPSGGEAEIAHHEIMSLEVPSIEFCARNILCFPGMPWDFVVDMARQCWDEGRHTDGFLRHMRQHGGRLGQLPIDHKLWCMTQDLPLSVALAAHQRLGESIGVDGGLFLAKKHAAEGEQEAARLYEFVARDEITHVAFGNKWLGYLLHREGNDLEKIVAAATERRAEFSAPTKPLFPPNPWALRRAGFTEDDIEFMQEMAAESVRVAV